MMAAAKSGNILCELLFEVRFKANPKVLDKRGAWASTLSEEFNFPNWKVTEDRLDLQSDDKKISLFIGHRNCGFTHQCPSSSGEFQSGADKAINSFVKLEGFANPVHVERIGMRSRFIEPYSGTFEKLRNQYTKNYFGLTEEAKNIFDCTVVDVGAPINFTDKLGNFNTVSGPMRQKQISQLFHFTDDLPEVGLFFDIDYWIRPNEPQKAEKIIKTISSFSSKAWERQLAVKGLILGQK